MRLLILSDMFSLESWLIGNEEPKIMPAVYNFYKVLGRSDEHSFTAIIFHPTVEKEIAFENGSSIQIKKLSVPFHYIRKYFSLKAMKREALRQLEKDEYDVIYGMTIYSTVAEQVGKEKQIHSVARLFGSLIWDAMQKNQIIKLRTRFHYQYLEAKKPCDTIICTEDGTEFDKALAEINPGKQAHMLYNGIERELKEDLLSIPIVEHIPEEGLRLISIGRLTSWKRHDLTIDVMDSLVHEFGLTNSHLTILGKGKEEEALLDKIKSLGLQSNIQIKPPIPHRDIPELLNKYHIGLFMYDASNLGNAMWETALAGRLICTRPSGKTSEVFVKGNNCLMSDNAKGMARKISFVVGKSVREITKRSREDIGNLLPSWKDRIKMEMKIIENEWKV